MAADRAVGRHGAAVDDRQLAWHRSRTDRVGSGLRLPAAAHRVSQRRAVRRGVNVRTCIYVAGITGLTALVSHSGLGDRLGSALLAMMPDLHGKPFTAFGSLVGITALLNFVVTANGVPALFTRWRRRCLRAAAAAAADDPVIGYATPLLPYQASPIVVAMGMGKVPAREGLKLCLLLPRSALRCWCRWIICGSDCWGGSRKPTGALAGR